MLDILQKHGHNEVDTARLYTFGSSETYLGQLKWQERGLTLGTKLSAMKFGPNPHSFTKDGLKHGLLESLEALQSEKVDLWYLHKPDVRVASFHRALAKPRLVNALLNPPSDPHTSH